MKTEIKVRSNSRQCVTFKKGGPVPAVTKVSGLGDFATFQDGDQLKIWLNGGPGSTSVESIFTVEGEFAVTGPELMPRAS